MSRVYHSFQKHCRIPKLQSHLRLEYDERLPDMLALPLFCKCLQSEQVKLTNWILKTYEINFTTDTIFVEIKIEIHTIILKST